MKRSIPFLLSALALVVLVAGVAYAGGGHGESHASAESCLSAKAAKIARHGWLGVETEKAAGGYAITKVYPDSPAAKAGFRAGDVLLAVNGARFADEKAVKAEKAKLRVGSAVAYTVARAGSEQTIQATLAEVPRQVMAQWLGEDVLDHHVETRVAEN